MRRVGMLLVAGVLAAACGGSGSKPPGAGSAASVETPTHAPAVGTPATKSTASVEAPTPPEASAATVIEPPPPAGVPVPRGVRVVSVENGGANASYYWKATLAADPTDSYLRAREEQARAAGDSVTLGAAAIERYREDVVTAGHQVTGFAFMPGFDYTVPGEKGPLAVFVRVPGNDPHGSPPDPGVAVADEHGPFFEIVVGPAGG
jgi:hypothetical protein